MSSHQPTFLSQAISQALRSIPEGHMDPIASIVPQSTPLDDVDGYKLSHKGFLPEGIEDIYLNVTARSGARAVSFNGRPTHVTNVGHQMFIKEFLLENFGDNFFKKPVEEVIQVWKTLVDSYLGEGSVPMEHFRELHAYGRVPLTIKTLPEGVRVPYRVPLMTLRASNKKFAWFVGFIETVLSSDTWDTITAATTAHEFKRLFTHYADLTCDNRDHVLIQGHDFSARGRPHHEAAAYSGVGHLASFWGTDTVAAIRKVMNNYGGDQRPNQIIGCSVPASEHALTSLGIAMRGELETMREWITKAYPTGIVSLVWDTENYFKGLTERLPALKADIMARKPAGFLPAKVVVRPDSGNPFRIICGYQEDEIVRHADGSITAYDTGARLTEEEVQGSLRILETIFPVTVNHKGFKVLDSHIGLIYGDSITLQLAEQILQRMMKMGWASSNVVFGIGSFTYQYVTRDTHGIAIKATSATVEGADYALSKKPATDNGIKNSARGLLRVDFENGDFVLRENVTPEEEAGGFLIHRMIDGYAVNFEDFGVIRERLESYIGQPSTCPSGLK